MPASVGCKPVAVGLRTQCRLGPSPRARARAHARGRMRCATRGGVGVGVGRRVSVLSGRGQKLGGVRTPPKAPKRVSLSRICARLGWAPVRARTAIPCAVTWALQATSRGLAANGHELLDTAPPQRVAVARPVARRHRTRQPHTECYFVPEDVYGVPLFTWQSPWSRDFTAAGKWRAMGLPCKGAAL